MKRIVDFIFKSNEATESLMILFARLAFGIALMQHGTAKMMGFALLKDAFPDPVGWGGAFSLSLVIFAEVFCALALIFGFMQRLAVIPIIISMCVAFFVAHSGSVAEGELSLLYMFAFVMLLISGAGKYSMDYWLYKKLLTRFP